MSKDNKVNTEKITRERKLFEITFLLSLGRGNKLFDLTKEIENFIIARGGEVLEVEKKETEEFKGGKGKFWSERRKMAYAINKEKACYYTTFWFNLETSFITDLKRFLKLKSEITRFMLVCESEIFALNPSRKAVLTAEIMAGTPREEKVYVEEKKVEPTLSEAPKTEEAEEVKTEPAVTETAVIEETEPEVKTETEPSLPEITEEVPEVAEQEKEEEKEESATIETSFAKAMAVEEEKIEEIEEEPAVEETSATSESVFDIEKALEIPDKAPEEQEVTEDLKEEPMEELEADEEKVEEAEDKEAEEFRKEKKKAEDKSGKQRKITLEELDSKLDDILNDDII